MGFRRLPEGKQLIAQTHDIGVGDVLQAQIKGVSQPTTRLLAAEHTTVENLPGLLLRQPTLGAHITVAEGNAAVLKPHRRDHAVAIKGVMNAMPIPLKTSGAIAIKGALKLRRHRSTHRRQRHVGEFLLHIDEGTGPVAAVVAAGGGDSHGRMINVRPSSRNGL